MTNSLPVATLAGMAAPYNPRTISTGQLAALRKSLRAFGAVQAVVVNKRSGRIVGGHQRVKAAEAEGIESLPVAWVDLDEVGERQLNLALNKISGEWDDEALMAAIMALRVMEVDLDLTGFTSTELDALTGSVDLSVPEKVQGQAHEIVTCPKCGFQWSSVRGRPSPSSSICH